MFLIALCTLRARQGTIAKLYIPSTTSIKVYQIDLQDEISVQVGKFLKNIKRAGQNRRAGGKLSGKSINVQGGKFMENQ